MIMGKIRITLYGTLARITGEKTTDLDALTVKEAIRILVAKYGEKFNSRIYDENGNLRRFVNIYVNGKDVRFLEDLATELRDSDEISIIPAVGGG